MQSVLVVIVYLVAFHKMRVHNFIRLKCYSLTWKFYEYCMYFYFYSLDGEHGWNSILPCRLLWTRASSLACLIYSFIGNLRSDTDTRLVIIIIKDIIFFSR